MRLNYEYWWKSEKAYALHHSGYNCAQAVLGAYVDLFDLDMDRAMTIAYGFGDGSVGMTREICGTLTGGAMALGLKYGKGEADVKQKLLMKKQLCVKNLKIFMDQRFVENY